MAWAGHRVELPTATADWSWAVAGGATMFAAVGAVGAGPVAAGETRPMVAGTVPSLHGQKAAHHAGQPLMGVAHIVESGRRHEAASLGTADTTAEADTPSETAESAERVAVQSFAHAGQKADSDAPAEIGVNLTR